MSVKSRGFNEGYIAGFITSMIFTFVLTNFSQSDKKESEIAQEETQTQTKESAGSSAETVDVADEAPSETKTQEMVSRKGPREVSTMVDQAYNFLIQQKLDRNPTGSNLNKEDLEAGLLACRRLLKKYMHGGPVVAR